jgi:hypothetical protein
MSAAVGNHRSAYDQLVFNRRLLVVAHVSLGLFAAFWYLYHVNFSHFPYWTRGASKAAVSIAAPAILPYLLSGIHSWQVVTVHRFRVWIFLLVLVAGTVFVNIFSLGYLGTEPHEIAVMSAVGLQILIFLWAGEMLLNVV